MIIPKKYRRKDKNKPWSIDWLNREIEDYQKKVQDIYRLMSTAISESKLRDCISQIAVYKRNIFNNEFKIKQLKNNKPPNGYPEDNFPQLRDKYTIEYEQKKEEERELGEANQAD